MTLIRRMLRHRNCLDIDFYLAKDMGDSFYLVYYWNRHSKIFQGSPEVLFIDPDRFEVL